jgi:predicted dehydrogenase
MNTTTRRRFLVRTAVASLATVASPHILRAGRAQYRVAVIGHTGRGNYGHGIDTVWREVAGTEVVAVADADPKGLQDAIKRLGNPKGFADYRQMLEEMKPDLVAVGPRWVDQHRDMVVAAAERGARGIYMEKPLCRSLAEADEMVVVCERHGVKVAVAHQSRYSPIIPVIRQLIDSGQLGRLVEIRGRGKEDHRGGGEDLFVLGTHVFDLINLLAGPPQWCLARVFAKGHPIGKEDVQPGSEGIGPLAGDEVHAMYGLAQNVTAYFDSVRNAGGEPTRFGLSLYGTKGVVEVSFGYLPTAHFLPGSSWSPGRSGKTWIPISSAGVGQPEPLADGGLPAGNLLAVKDLIAALEEDRRPVSSIHDARIAMEMIFAVFESHRLGRSLTIPLENRENPLGML